MSVASDLIERAEREAGCRWDDPDNPSALAVLFGAMARELGVSKFEEQDDAVVGTVLMDEIANGEKRRQDGEMLVALLRAGLGPDDISALNGKTE